MVYYNHNDNRDGPRATKNGGLKMDRTKKTRTTKKATTTTRKTTTTTRKKARLQDLEKNGCKNLNECLEYWFLQ